MARVVHLAVTVDNLEQFSKIYREVFDFIHTGTIVNPAEKSNGKIIRSGYTAHHLNDGLIDFTLLHYDDEEFADAGSPLMRTGLHHFGIEVKDPEAVAAQITRLGGKVLSAAHLLPVKFRTPGGIVAEAIPEGRFSAERIIQASMAAKRREEGQGQSTVSRGVAALPIHEGPVLQVGNAPHICQLMLYVDDREREARFFRDIFGFDEIGSQSDESPIVLTDGKLRLSIQQWNSQADAAVAKFDRSCIHHFSIAAEPSRIECCVPQLTKLGCEVRANANALNIRFHVPEEGMIAEMVPG
jgi:lactoylglutathione lyase